MTSFRMALNRALRCGSRSNNRVVERVHEAFSKWTQQADSGLTAVGSQSIGSPDPTANSALASIETAHPANIHTEELSRVVEPDDKDCHAALMVERVEIENELRHADYYEVLQISRAAETETIHRVYRMMAARFHPDNALTGNLEKFLALHEAYQVLANPELRAEYDRKLHVQSINPLSVFGQMAFVGGHQIEMNRRLGVLSLLYNRRRVNEDRPGSSVLDLESWMSLPREYLQFTLWYLKSKGYIAMEDNSDYSVTPAGVDYLEKQSGKSKLIQELLTGQSVPEKRSGQPELIDCGSSRRPVKKTRKRRTARRNRTLPARRQNSAA